MLLFFIIYFKQNVWTCIYWLLDTNLLCEILVMISHDVNLLLFNGKTPHNTDIHEGGRGIQTLQVQINLKVFTNLEIVPILRRKFSSLHAFFSTHIYEVVKSLEWTMTSRFRCVCSELETLMCTTAGLSARVGFNKHLNTSIFGRSQS